MNNGMLKDTVQLS